MLEAQRNKPLYYALILFFAALQVQCASKNAVAVKDSAKSQSVRSSKSLSYLHFMMGELSSAKNEPQAALEHYRYASHFDPESDTLKLRQSEQLVNLDRIDEAKKLLKDIETRDDPKFFTLQSRIATMEFDIETAVESLQEAENLFRQDQNLRKSRELLLTRVALLSDYRKYEEALKALESHIEKNPYDEIAHYFRGKIYSIQRKNREAKDAFRRAIDLRPSFLAASKALGLRLELEGQINEAIAVYEEAFAHASQDKTIVQKLANLHLIQEDYVSALEYLKQAVRLDPNDTVSQLRTGLLYYKMKRYQEAKELFETILQNEQVAHDRVHFYMASMNEDKGDFKQAASHYRAIKPESDYFSEARLQLANLYHEKDKEQRRAITSLKEAIQLKPQERELHIALANLHEKSNQLKEAILVLDQATKAIPDDQRILFILGSLLDRAGDYQTGIQRMEQVLEINPNHAFALNHIGYVLAEKGKELDRAEKLLRKAVQLAPDNGHILDSMGWLYYQKKDYKRAKHYLERAVEIAKEEPVILEHLADTYQKLGLNQQALEIYRRVMRLSAREENRQEIDDAFQKRLRDKIASLDADDTLQ